MNEFRKLIKESITKKGLKINTVANEMKISSSYLYGLIRGDKVLNEELIESICKVLEIEIVFKQSA